MLPMVAIHVIGHIHVSQRHYENWVKLMAMGEKRAADVDDVT